MSTSATVSTGRPAPTLNSQLEKIDSLIVSKSYYEAYQSYRSLINKTFLSRKFDHVGRLVVRAVNQFLKLRQFDYIVQLIEFVMTFRPDAAPLVDVPSSSIFLDHIFSAVISSFPKISTSRVETVPTHAEVEKADDDDDDDDEEEEEEEEEGKGKGKGNEEEQEEKPVDIDVLNLYCRTVDAALASFPKLHVLHSVDSLDMISVYAQTGKFNKLAEFLTGLPSDVEAFDVASNIAVMQILKHASRSGFRSTRQKSEIIGLFLMRCLDMYLKAGGNKNRKLQTFHGSPLIVHLCNAAHLKLGESVYVRFPELLVRADEQGSPLLFEHVAKTYLPLYKNVPWIGEFVLAYLKKLRPVAADAGAISGIKRTVEEMD
eukprot:ANDGO_03091.mRNA.1 hypothetical protein